MDTYNPMSNQTAACAN